MERYWLRFVEIYMIIPAKSFVGLSVMPVAELLDLPTVREKRIFSQFLDKG